MDAIRCANCKTPYPDVGTPYHCPRCKSLFDFPQPLIFDANKVDYTQPGIWRYRHSFILPEDAPTVSLGEGNTPLVWADYQGKRVALKCEHLNPTGSFKDRGSALIASFLLARGASHTVEDSSGNAGASYAAYAARAGLQASIYVPDSASGPKRRQIEVYGADVVRIMGPRTNATEAVLRAVERGETYASHAYLPFNLPGYATAAYEIYEQLGEAPGTVITPAGQGGLLLGMGRGFEALLAAGKISQAPRLVGVQARACAPLWAVYAYGAAGLGWVAEAPTLAEGIRVLNPLRGDAVLSLIERHKGAILAVDEEQILPARDELARQGFYIEPTSAVVWAAIGQIIEDAPEPIVAVLTGSGLKTSHND